MSGPARESDPAWRAIWPVRPPQFSRSIWPLLLAADTLPYPWGEDLFAHLFVAKAFAQIRPLQKALGWAASYRRQRRERWQPALACCAYHGRFVARSALVGVRHPDEFRRQVVLKGTEHLPATAGAAIGIASAAAEAFREGLRPSSVAPSEPLDRGDATGAAPIGLTLAAVEVAQLLLRLDARENRQGCDHEK